MRYLGGKFALRKQISGYLESVRGGRDYLEPFVGGAHVLCEMSGNRTASDVNPWLIKLWHAVQDGYCGPESMTIERYKQLKYDKPMHPDTAFAAFGCSFGAKWFGGYALDGFISTKNSLKKSRSKIQNVKFRCCSYEEHRPKNMLIYCDPPYANTTGYTACHKFDHEKFWDTMRNWSTDNIVVISEYQAPPDFECVLEMQTRLRVRSKNGCDRRTERLFRVKENVKWKLRSKV